ncbi:MAG TPA: cohesin domain-containing protein [Candidatus Binatia bacterium]|nr:cohesin domain-containing protein [Candidatus Binatia bacterium]
MSTPSKGMRRGALFAVVVASSLAGRAAAVTLEVGSASTTPGGTVEVGVRMQAGSGERVAAVQNDIVFDSSVATVTRRDCRINPNIDKSLNVGLPSPNTIRIIIISLERSDPIPASDLLYTCTFHIGPDAPDGNIVLNIANVGASDPGGTKLPASGIGGSIFVSAPSSAGGGVQPQAAPAAPRAGAAAPAPAQLPAGVQPGGAVVQPGVPGAPPPPQPERALQGVPEMAGVQATMTPAATAPAAAATAKATATPGKAATAAPEASATKGTPEANATATAKPKPTKIETKE